MSVLKSGNGSLLFSFFLNALFLFLTELLEFGHAVYYQNFKKSPSSWGLEKNLQISVVKYILNIVDKIERKRSSRRKKKNLLAY